MFKTSILSRFIPKLSWLAALLMISLCVYPQNHADSLSTSYDSLQDLRLNQLQRRVDRQLREMEVSTRESRQMRDSLASMIEHLQQKNDRLERQDQRLDAQISTLRDNLESTYSESVSYREKLERTLWMAGTVLFMLIAISMLLLWFYSLRTRWMLEKLQVRISKLRKSLREQRKKLRRAPGMQKKSIRRITRSEVQNRVKAIRKKKR